ncbi:hypothetical protein KBF61_03440 [Candidatus Saccharibacteria bacterium]|jgi:hypothetical protein|nr:hypothetical protein [Candidatus Saccharibacteria bacterium]
MTLTNSAVQKVSLGAFYGIFMFASAANSVFAASTPQTTDQCKTLTGGISGGVNCAGGSSSVSGTNLLGSGGIFEKIVNLLLFIVGAISVIMLIVGGIRYVISAGDQNAVTGAKNTILYAIIGLVISFLAFAAVRFVVGALDPTNATTL